MKIDILTLFPEMFKGPFDESIIKRAQEKVLVDINIYNVRDWATDNHKTVDDRPYGGGAGMILKVDILDQAINSLKIKAKRSPGSKQKIILLDAGGKKFNQEKALEYSKLEYLQLVAGHYEGFDYRVQEKLVDEVVSIGDYILTGGEIPAMVLTDAVVRLIPGVLEKPEATEFESFSPITNNQQPTALLEYPQYTRPEEYKGWKVPEVLLSGNHKEIEKWRMENARKRTEKTRPDLIIKKNKQN